MAEGKSLKFQFSVDEASLQKTRSLIRELIGDLSKLNEAASKASGGGGVGGLGPGFNVTGGGSRSPEQQRVVAKVAPAGRQLVQGFLDQKQIFKGIADGSKDSMRVMNDTLRQAIDFQKRELRDLDNAAKHLVETYDELGGKLKNWQGKPGMSGAIQSQRDTVGLDHQRIVGERSREAEKLSRLQSIQSAQSDGFLAEDMKAAGMGGGAMSKLRGMKVGGGMGSAAAMMAVANFGLDESLAGSRSFTSAEGRRGDMVESRIRGMMGGDTKFLFNLSAMQRDSNTRQDLKNQTSGFSANAEQIRAGVGQFAGSIPLLGNIGRSLGLVGADTGGGILGGFTTARQQTAMGMNAFQQMDEHSKSTAMLYANMAQEKFRGGLAQRVSLQRTTGIGGLNIDPRTGRVSDNFQDLSTSLEAQGLDIGSYQAARVGLRGMAGSNFASGRGNAYTAMAAQAQGYGGFDSVMAASARMGMSKSLAMGALGGGIDKAAGIQLGQAVLGSGFDPMGTTNGMGTMVAAQQGMGFSGTSSDFNRVAMVQAGLGLGSQITTGAIDPYQQARNLVGGIRNAGPGASTYSQDFMGNGMSMKQMLDMARPGGRLTTTAKALGLTNEGIKGQLSDSMSSVFDRFSDSGASDPMSKAIRAYRKSGLQVPEYLQQLRKNKDTDSIDALGVGYNQLLGTPEAEGVGVARLLSGDQSSRLDRGKIGGGVGGVEAEMLASQAKMQKDVDNVLKIIAKDLSATVAAMPEATKKMASFGENLGASGDQFIDELVKITEAIRESRLRLTGQPLNKTATGTKAAAPGRK